MKEEGLQDVDARLRGFKGTWGRQNVCETYKPSAELYYNKNVIISRVIAIAISLPSLQQIKAY